LQRARSKLEGIPAFVLASEKKKDPVHYAKIMQLAGISAFYANDIDAAIHRLEEADIASKEDQRPETTLSRAYTKHFLGVAFKNWCLEGSPISKNVEKAALYLMDAFEAVKEEKKQFLIPVTLAEVMSYQSGAHEDAEKLLGEIIDRLEKLRDSESLDPNQSALLLRAHLYKGNISYKAGRLEEALQRNKEALTVGKKNHYAQLSVLQCEFAMKMPIDTDRWREALRLLEASGALKKREITTRIVALAWGFIVSATINDQDETDRFRKEFEGVGRNIRSIAHRFPVFFSPLSKGLMTFVDLKQELNDFVDRPVSVPKTESA